MGRDAAMLRREAEGDGDVEFCKRLHLPIEPGQRVGAEAVGPGQAGSQMANAEPAQPVNDLVDAVILEMKPLAGADGGSVLQRLLRARYGRADLAQQTALEIPVIEGSYRVL